MLDYRARMYDPAIGRFISADTVVPDYANPQDLNRYSYVRNSPLRYTDPTGHFSAEEMCSYWGYCSKSEAEAGLGNLVALLWETQITWGDLLFMGDANGVQSTAMFVLLGGDYEGEKYGAALWGIAGNNAGKYISPWDAQDYSILAAYSRDENVWESSTGGRQQVEQWVGKIPTVAGAESLAKAVGSEDYYFATYTDLNPTWITLNGAAVVASLPLGGGTLTARIVAALAVANTVTTIAKDSLRLKVLPGPIDATYPVVLYDPLHIGGVSRFSFTPPPGVY